MLAKAEARFIRGSGKKYRLVADLIRGMRAAEALNYLRFVNKRATHYIGKVLASAIANAKVKGLETDRLVISRITADDGPRWKRFRAAAFGRATEILKRTSHICIELDMPQAAEPVKAAPVEAEEKKIEKKRPRISLRRKPAKARKAAASKR